MEKIDKEKLVEIPETINQDLFFEMKVFYGMIILSYVALGVLIIVS